MGSCVFARININFMTTTVTVVFTTHLTNKHLGALECSIKYGAGLGKMLT